MRARPLIAFATLALVACVADAGENSASSNNALTSAAVAASGVNLRTMVAPDGTTKHFRGCASTAVDQGRCTLLIPSDDTGRVLGGATTPSGWGATDLQSAYSIPTAGGAGTTVGIVDPYDNPNVEADLGTYRSQYGLSACTTANGCFKKINQSGQTSPLPAAAGTSGNIATEIDLDVQIVSAACPNCKIVLVEANSFAWSDMMAAEQAAVNAGATLVSNSWQFGEWSGETGNESNFSKPGVSFFASAGDTGDVTGYPATSANVTAVGGTVLSQASGGRGWSETVWGSSGSGCSAYVGKPAWQTDANCSTRTVSDISAVASGVAMYDSYSASGWISVAGTSISSPLVAAIYAAAGLRGATPSLGYRDPQAFYDITSGSNGTCGNYLCNGETGYDGPTGNGTPNGNVIGAFVPRTFDAVDFSDMVVLGQDGKLWYEHGPFGSVPPNRQEIDASVNTFQILDSSDVLVLGRNGALWYEHAPFGTVPPARQQVDGNVRAFQALSSTDVVVLGNDGTLWYEHAPFGTVPPVRQEIDASVLSFQAVGPSQILVLGTDGKLWMEEGPFGTVPPARQEVDASVREFAYDNGNVIVLGRNGVLWMEQPPFGTVPPKRVEIDASVRTFQAYDSGDLFVLGNNGALWLERAPFGTVPPARSQVDGNVASFRMVDENHVLSLGTDGKLWFESAPFGTVPPARSEVDANVAF